MLKCVTMIYPWTSLSESILKKREQHTISDKSVAKIRKKHEEMYEGLNISTLECRMVYEVAISKCYIKNPNITKHSVKEKLDFISTSGIWGSLNAELLNFILKEKDILNNLVCINKMLATAINQEEEDEIKFLLEVLYQILSDNENIQQFAPLSNLRNWLFVLLDPLNEGYQMFSLKIFSASIQAVLFYILNEVASEVHTNIGQYASNENIQKCKITLIGGISKDRQRFSIEAPTSDYLNKKLEQHNRTKEKRRLSDRNKTALAIKASEKQYSKLCQQAEKEKEKKREKESKKTQTESK